MKAKDYKSITEVLDKKYNKGIVNKKDKIKFYSFNSLSIFEISIIKLVGVVLSDNLYSGTTL